MKLMRVRQPEFWGLAPFERMRDLREEINRLFEAPVGELSRAGEFFNEWAPALDLREDKDNLVAHVELPGLKRDDIDVSVHDGVLSVSGERACEKKDETGGTYRCERRYGRFHRTVTLPRPISLDKIKATYRDGVLSVIMPKTEEAKPKQIDVKAE